MKTRYKILPIIVIGIISVFAINNGHDLFHYMNLPYEWHDSFGFIDTNIVRSTQCASEELAWLEPCIDVKMVSDNTPKQLEAILEHCIDSKDLVDTVGLSYDNGTHRIDTVSCKWADIAQIPIDPTFEMNRNDLSQVLDWCNDISEVKYGFYNYSNETHSIDTSTCEWKPHEPYPTGGGLCIPYVEKWVMGVDWNNGTHYFDSDSCKWKIDSEFDALNSKGCPQFCPKESTLLLESHFEEIKSNIGKTGYGICGIQLEGEKIIIHLNWIFEDSEYEQEILSKIPNDIDYEIIYYDDYVDFSPQTLREPHCDSLEIDDNNFPHVGEFVENEN